MDRQEGATPICSHLFRFPRFLPIVPICLFSRIPRFFPICSDFFRLVFWANRNTSGKPPSAEPLVPEKEARKGNGCFSCCGPSSNFSYCPGPGSARISWDWGPENQRKPLLYKVFREPFGSWTSAPKIVDVCFSVTSVVGRSLLTPGHPGVSVRNVRRKSGPKSLCLCCFSSQRDGQKPLFESETCEHLCKIQHFTLRNSANLAEKRNTPKIAINDYRPSLLWVFLFVFSRENLCKATESCLRWAFDPISSPQLPPLNPWYRLRQSKSTLAH